MIDNSIYNNLLRPPKSIAEYDAEAMQGQQNRLALQMNQAKMGEYQRGVDQENALGQAYKVSTGADGKIDRNKLFTSVAQSGQGAKLPGIQKSFADQDKADLEAGKAKLEAGMKQFEAMAQIMSGVRDQASYDVARQQAMQIMGPEAAARIPPMYNPAEVEAGRLKAMGIKDQMEMHYKEVAAELASDKFKYDQTNDAANRGVQVRGQNMTASTAAASRAQSAKQHGERLAFDKSKPLDGSAKPMPATALKMQQAELDAIGIASGIQADLGAVEKQISDGKLDFGPINNLVDRGRNLAGMSSEASRNKASFKSTLEKLRNDSLRLNTGVQTDGDAQRAWSELFENINDKGVVTQRLAEIKRLNERAVKLRKLNVDGIRSNYGRDPVDTTGYENQTPALGATKLPGGWTVEKN